MMNKSILPLSILLAAILCLSTETLIGFTSKTERTRKDYALFFAVDDYTTSSQFDNLKNPIGDANAIAEQLRDMYNFETQVYENKSSATIFEILRRWRERRFNADDQLFIFFSGHGDFSDFTAKGYFVAHGNRERGDNEYIDLTDLRNIITGIPCEHILLAIDACYSGTMDERIAFKSPTFSRPNISSTTERDRLIHNLLRNDTRLVVTSGGKERTPDGLEHSPFSNAILRGLRYAYVHGDGFFTYKDLLGRLERVDPQPYSGVMNGHEEGSFIFVSSERSGISGADISRPEADVSPMLLGRWASDFVRVQGGTFQMGDTFGEGGSNEPVRSVEVSTFYISKFEVTFAEYDLYCSLTGKDKPDDMGWGRGKHPVINVSWCDVVEYANWMSEYRGLQKVYSGDCESIEVDWSANGYRLPTEAEWEYAARDRGRKVRFGNGENILRSSEVNFWAREDWKMPYSEAGLFRGRTIEVGSLNHPNALGLHDITGNVWEFCWDWLVRDESGSRVVRGGGWRTSPAGCRVTYRAGSHYRYGGGDDLGFRLVRSS